MTLRALWIAATVMAWPVAATSQATDASATLPDASSSDDIIVTALRIDREQLPTSVYWSYSTLLPNRIARENAQMFMRCAINLTAPRSLRLVVDGEPNSLNARTAQGSIMVTMRGCSPPLDEPVGAHATAIPRTLADIGSSLLDRGVITELALKRYAPDAALTPAMTADPAVRDRFERRESFRNRIRMSGDRDALVFASCLVRTQPSLATRLFRSKPGSLLERGLIQAIIVEGRQCVGGAKRLTVEPTSMRIYIVDAFYRWVVAARGVDSLIPADT